MGKEIKLSNEELLQLLRNVYKKEGIVKTSQFKASNGLPCYSYYVKIFGSWEKAKTLAGVPNFNRRQKHITKEVLISKFKDLMRNRNEIPTVKELENSNFPIQSIWKNFNNYDEFVTLCGFKHNTTFNGAIKNEFLLDEIKRFVEEFHRIPIQKDFEHLKGYPSRKTFTNHFGSFNEAIRKAGFEPKGLSVEENKYRYTKEYLFGIINDYIEKYNEVPTMKKLNKEVGFEVKVYYKKVFDGWNNALKELNLPLNSVLHYEDEFLHSEFERFIKENDRIPVLQEFNNSEYPSFWCYQSRFGSWNNAVMAYGYEPNDSNRKYYMDDGEICASSYEYIISNWLKERKIKYDRDIPYKEIDQFGYKGKMDCDYKIYYNNKIWFVEMAGFMRGTNFNKFSKEEKNYFFKLKYKKKLLRRNEINYIVIESGDMKNATFEEVFSKMLNN